MFWISRFCGGLGKNACFQFLSVNFFLPSMAGGRVLCVMGQKWSRPPLRLYQGLRSMAANTALTRSIWVSPWHLPRVAKDSATSKGMTNTRALLGSVTRHGCARAWTMNSVATHQYPMRGSCMDA